MASSDRGILPNQKSFKMSKYNMSEKEDMLGIEEFRVNHPTHSTHFSRFQLLPLSHVSPNLGITDPPKLRI